MHIDTKRIILMSGLAGLLMAGAVRSAYAGCAIGHPSTLSGLAHASPAVFNPDDYGAGIIRIATGSPSGAPIVGLWKFEMLSKSMDGNTNPMPDGTLLDFGTQAWHADGTELMNSGIRDPGDGDFCQGVWKKVGPSTFALNHMALAWGGGSYLGPVIIQMQVTVAADGNSFEGNLSETVYAASAVAGQEFDTSTEVIKLTGTITGTRIGND